MTKKKFRIWDSRGIAQVAECDSVTFIKTKNGLTIKPKGLPIIKGAIALVEIAEPQIIEVVQNSGEEDET